MEQETNIRRMMPPQLKFYGTARDAENDHAICVIFSRPLTDGEMRFFHDVCARTAPLMDGEDL